MPEQTTKFRKRDEVRALVGPNRGKRGWVTGPCNLDPERRTHVAFPGLVGESDGCTPTEHLELVARNNFDRPVSIVGITGRKRTGKDTVAARLVEKHGFKRLAFADNVRKVALAIDPMVEADVGYRRLSTVVDFLGWEDAKAIPEVRRLLQRIGTEAIRSLEPDFWIRQVMRRVQTSAGKFVITDVRFPNEADAIKKAGGVILRVSRAGLPKEDTHSSETAMDEYLHDWGIPNNGTIADLHKAVDELVANGFQARR